MKLKMMDMEMKVKLMEIKMLEMKIEVEIEGEPSDPNCSTALLLESSHPRLQTYAHMTLQMIITLVFEPPHVIPSGTKETFLQMQIHEHNKWVVF